MASAETAEVNGEGAEGAQVTGQAGKSKSKSKPKSSESRLRITQVRSGNGRPSKHRATLAALGLKRHQHSVVQIDNPAIRGMIFQVRHLVQVEELEGEE
jgi:large subunit ribosomal protein L30